MKVPELLSAILVIALTVHTAAMAQPGPPSAPSSSGNEMSGEPSPSGSWVVSISKDLTQLFVVEKYAREAAIDTDTPPDGIVLQGHPLGLIWQECWLSESRLLVGTGLGELVCFGVLDASEGIFYSLACCGTPQCSLRELREARRDARSWLDAKGLLADPQQWNAARPDSFPWMDLSPRN